ncbi:interferon alpha/beta receptor 1a-like [Tachysurus ichikawai]
MFSPCPSVSASLPAPQQVKMIAQDANYMLQWDCNYAQLENPITFTAEYTYYPERNDEGSYKRVCEGSSECRCDFTHCGLPFSGSFQIRVRAEAGLLRSEWAAVNFTPDLDVILMPPQVNMTTDKDVLTLTISKSVLSDTMMLQYKVQYWEKLKPEEKHMEVYASPHFPLSSLKYCTEYCVQVRIFSPYINSSNYSSPQCKRTTGCPFAWLGILFAIPLFGAFVCYKCRRTYSVYTTPESMLAIPSTPSLLEVQEEHWTVAHVITPAIEPKNTVEKEQEQENTAEPQAPKSIGQWSHGSVQDSGFSSGLES